MARWEFKLPDIGEGVTEGEVVQWLVKPGDVVKEDQPMVEVMTDKATVTITSPKAGTIVETNGKPGQIVKVHSVLVVYELGNGGTASAGAGASAGPAATAVGDIREDLPGMSLMRGASPATPASSSASSSGGASLQNAYFSEKPLATPATRKLARDLDVDLKRVPPTGPNGRVTKDDVQRFGVGPRNGHASAAPAAQPSMQERVPFVGIRRKIAEKMSTSKNTAAHFTFVEECDCTALKQMRERLKPHAEREGVKLTYLAFIAKAVVASIRRHPTLNSTLDTATNELVVRRNVNLGIAAATDAGLVVPVIKDAHAMTLLDLAREIDRLGNAAKAQAGSQARPGQGKLKPAELVGSTFTITSLGAQGGLFATPIINFPEVAILGVHQMKQKPVVRNGQIVIGDVMLLSLSFDHRIIDGHVGAAFAYEIIGYLQEPDRFLLES